MVADACYYCTAVAGPADSNRRQLGPCTFYLFNFLKMQKVKPLETLLAVNIMLQLVFLYTGTKTIIIVALAVTLFCLLFPPVLQLLHRVWSGVFSFIGKLNATLLLGLLYFLLLVPLALLRKITTRTGKIQPADNYRTREHLFTASDFERPG